jgi:acyl-CoA thioesterase YciA
MVISPPEPPALAEAPPSVEPVLRTTAMPADTNPDGDIFGGWLLAHMDLAAGGLAIRRARGRCVTAAVEGLSFLSPVFVGDEVSMYARVVSTGRTSMRVFVEAWRRHRDSEETNRVTQATFIFVAVDQDRRPRPIPPEAKG